MSFEDTQKRILNKIVLLIRLGGELGIKSRQTRRRMKKNLQMDLKRNLEEFPSVKITQFRDRFILY